MVDMRMIDVVDSTRMIDIVARLILGKTVSEAYNELHRLKSLTRIVVNYFNPVPEDRERVVIDDFIIRVCVENGSNYAITNDYVKNRINVVIKDGIINQVMTLG